MILMQMFYAVPVSMLMSRVEVMSIARAAGPVRLYVDGGWGVGKTTLCRKLCASLVPSKYLPEPAHCELTEGADVAAYYIAQHRANNAAATRLQGSGWNVIVERCYLSTYAYYESVNYPLDALPLKQGQDQAPHDSVAYVILERTKVLPDSRGIVNRGQILDQQRLTRYYRALEIYCRKLSHANIAWLTDCDEDHCLTGTLHFLKKAFVSA